PGMGLGPDASAFIQQLLATPLRPPLVLDADALQLIARKPQLLDLIRPQDVLTPHPGEAAALLNITSTVVQKDRQKAMRGLLRLQKGVVLLKGAFSLIGQRNKPLLVSPWDIPQLSIGGAGDVLSGILGCLLAQRSLWQSLLSPLEHRPEAEKLPSETTPLPQFEPSPLFLTAKAVALHAMAALRLANRFPNRGFLAQELADELPFLAKQEAQS
ncbi:MAG: NAD(P)H-hydrate dehydratase, partial [Desulfovibrio sp.]|nr:NAD(P)H-hydrate dehydratase [Desulfovibrio sp.]